MKQRGHGTSAHLFGSIHMVYAFGKPQKSSQKACRSSGAAHIQAGLGPGNYAAQTSDSNPAGGLVYLCLKSQILYTFQKMSGIVGKKHTPQGGNALCQCGKQERTVRDALRARDINFQRPGRNALHLYRIIYEWNGIGQCVCKFVHNK